jgi:hypothetical protein
VLCWKNLESAGYGLMLEICNIVICSQGSTAAEQAEAENLTTDPVLTAQQLDEPLPLRLHQLFFSRRDQLVQQKW